ncbi:MAG TPA: PmoA family protein [Bryobacteraceae bacterium]|nr:PmoA family protein [Bryobacteraceae bacterium]
MKPVLWAVILALPVAAQVRIVQHGIETISVEIKGRPFTTFYIGPETNKPYLHPLRSASGKIVTRGYPMEDIPGETRDHPHHRGLWFSHGDVNGFDFWGNEQRGGKFGRIVLVKIDGVTSGKESGGIDATFDWRDPAGNTLLSEFRRMIFYAHSKLRMIDFDITLTARQKVVFGDTKEGTFALRLASALEEPHAGAPAQPARTGHIVDSEGRQGEKQVWGKRADWVDYYGVVDGEPLGVAIFDHPSNPRHPTWWHVRSYGLFAANIFGLHDFEHDKSKDGSLTLQPGGALQFRYRVVIHPGDVNSAHIARLYAEYTAAHDRN